jgi:hypothetical protein
VNNMKMKKVLSVKQTKSSLQCHFLQFQNRQKKICPVTGMNRPTGWIEVWPYPFMTLAVEGVVWSASRPGRFTPGKDPVPNVKEAGWAPGMIWTCAKNLAPTRIRSLDRPVRSQSLYRLSYPGPFQTRYCQ